MNDGRELPTAPTASERRGVRVRRDETHSYFHEQKAPGSGLDLPEHLWVPKNARYRRFTRFVRGVGAQSSNFTSQWETVLSLTIDPGRTATLDFVGTETSNFGLFGDDESIEWHLMQDQTLVPGYESWTGCLQPTREPIRQQQPTTFTPGCTVILAARYIPVVMGGAADGANTFDVRAILGLWFVPV